MKDISVIMCTYNENIDELEKSIESILQQTFENFEFIIVLDNPDNKKIYECIKDYEKKDSRIKIIVNEKNMGLANSLNNGINIAQGKYIARMDADDISMPTRLKKEYDFLEKNMNIDIVSTNRIIIDENGNEIKVEKKGALEDKKIKRMLRYTNIIVHPSVMFNKEKIKNIGNYRNFTASQDYDLWLRACTANLNFAILEDMLIKYRVRNNSISNSNPLKQWVIHEYIRKLYKRREKYGKDNFSEQNLERLLIKNRVYDEKQKEKFKRGIKYVNKFKIQFAKKNIFSAVYLFLAVLSHKKMLSFEKCYIRGFLCKKNKGLERKKI